jgi:hypothetical protein
MSESMKVAMGTREQDLTLVGEVVRQRGFVRSTVLLVSAAALIVASIFFPYWTMRLNAPQYPKGLDLTVYLDHMEGDISEIDGLNHYIGMARIRDAARLERELTPLALVAIVLMIAATAVIHRKWFAPLVLPAMLLPLIFLADMAFWLRRYGQNLDPRAALSGAVKPFTPAVLGHGSIGQFSTDAALGSGFWMAAVASAMLIAGLHYRRQARLAAERARQARAA